MRSSAVALRAEQNGRREPETLQVCITHIVTGIHVTQAMTDADVALKPDSVNDIHAKTKQRLKGTKQGETKV